MSFPSVIFSFRNTCITFMILGNIIQIHSESLDSSKIQLRYGPHIGTPWISPATIWYITLLREWVLVLTIFIIWRRNRRQWGAVDACNWWEPCFFSDKQPKVATLVSLATRTRLQQVIQHSNKSNVKLNGCSFIAWQLFFYPLKFDTQAANQNRRSSRSSSIPSRLLFPFFLLEN